VSASAFADAIAAFAKSRYVGETEAAMARGTRKLTHPPGFAEDTQPFVYDEIVRGVAAKRVQDLIDRGVLGAKQVYRVIPERTFNRRLANREPLKVAEGDAIARLLRVTEAANKAFGDVDFARKWLDLPNPELSGRVPIELAETDAGAREVEDVLGRFAHGVFG
jgi:putative toxin-antitoxin system antitoxin component (TIGR02293 family)